MIFHDNDSDDHYNHNGKGMTMMMMIMKTIGDDINKRRIKVKVVMITHIWIELDRGAQSKGHCSLVY